MNDVAIVIVIGLVILLVWFFAKRGKAEKQRQEMDRRRALAREANRTLQEINKSLGFPEGTGPTGIMVDGEYRVVNVGHTERMKNDPTYAFGDKTAGILLEMNDLESALREAQASGDRVLEQKITRQLSELEKEVNALVEQQQRNR